MNNFISENLKSCQIETPLLRIRKSHPLDGVRVLWPACHRELRRAYASERVTTDDYDIFLLSF